MRRLLTMAAMAAMAIAPVPLAAQGERASGADPYVHPGAGVGFPMNAGGMTRGTIRQYDATGRDVSVAYEAQRRGDEIAAVTIYVYPSQLPATDPRGTPAERCRGEFEGAEAAIRQGREGVRDIAAAAPAAAPPGLPGAGTAGRLGFVLDGRRLVSDLYVYCVPGGNWVVKVRASWSEGHAALNWAAVLRAVAWPARWPSDPATLAMR